MNMELTDLEIEIGEPAALRCVQTGHVWCETRIELNDLFLWLGFLV